MDVTGIALEDVTLLLLFARILKEVSLFSLQTGSKNPCGGTYPCFAPIMGPVVDRPSVCRTYVDSYTEDEIHP